MMSKYDNLPKRIGIRKQKWIDARPMYCEPPYNYACKLCLRCCVNRKGKVRNRCGFKKAG